MEDNLRWNFNVFLLQIANELTERDLQKMKFVLRGYVTSAKCEEMDVLQYVAELQKLLLLTPTKLKIFKDTLTVIGRPDIVEKIEEKQAAFSTLHGENLEQKEYDTVCDGIEKAAAAGKFKSSPQTNLSASKRLATGGETGEVDVADGGDLPVALSSGAGLSSLEDLGVTKPVSNESCESYNTFSAMPSSAKEPTEDIYTSSYSSNGVIVEDDERLAWETPLKAPGKSEPSEASNAKELSEDFYTSSDSPKAVADPDLQIRGGPGHLDPEIRGGPGLPPNFSRPFGSHFGQKLSGGAGPPGPIPWIHQCKGMIFPDDDSPAGDTPMEDPEGSETLLKSTQHEAGHDPFGGARAKEKKSGSGFSLGNTKQNEKESSKMPTEDACASPTAPYPSDPMKDTEGTEPSQKKSKSSQHVPGHGVSSKSQHGHDVFQGYSSGGACDVIPYPFGLDAPYQGLPHGSHFPGGGAIPLGPPPMSSSSAGATPGAPYGFNPDPFGFHFPSGGATPSGLPPLSSSSAGPTQVGVYHKAGYSVGISNGSLYYTGDDKGIFMMKSGTRFFILIANGNSHAAEVDITFGGIYLGVWIAEANSQLCFDPLIIEGSAWAPGRLTYFSKEDAKKQKVNVEYFGSDPAEELNGQIVLEFKPEVSMLKLVVKHLWNEETQREICVPDFNTANIVILKERIKQNYNPDVSCLVMDGKILDSTMSFDAMENANEVIEFLCTKEELMIESPGIDPITMTVDPLEISVEDVKDFIEQNWNIPVSKQHLRFNGQNVEEIDLCYDVFVKSKERPKIKVDRDRDIEVGVSLCPYEDPQKVTINWFATLDELKEKLIQQHICETINTLQLNGVDISSEDKSKKLIDLNFKPIKSIITVYPVTTPKSTVRGFSANDFGSRTLGFGCGVTRGFGSQPSSSFKSRYRGIDDLAGSSTLRAETDEIQHDSAAAHIREGVVMLHGNEEEVFRDFKMEHKNWRFSKEKAVILTIQLIDQSTEGITGPSPPFMSAGIHDPGDPRNPMSTLVPPPLPE